MARIVETIPIRLDKPRTLLFTREAVKRIEHTLTQVWGREYTFYQALRLFAEVLADGDLTKLSFINMSVLLWAACRHEDPGLTLETVEEALPYADPGLLIPYIGPILQAWQAASPAPLASAAVQEERTPDPLDGSTGPPFGALSVTASA